MKTRPLAFLSRNGEKKAKRWWKIKRITLVGAIDFSEDVCYNEMEWIDEAGGILPFRKIASEAGLFSCVSGG